MRYDPLMHEISERPEVLNTTVLRPCEALSHLIQDYFLISNEHLLVPNNEWYILPDNSPHLIFYLFDKGDQVVPLWKLIGPRSEYRVIYRQDRLFTFACTFRPGGLSQLTRVPLNNLTDISVSPDELFENYSDGVYQQLVHHAFESDISKFIETFESFLIQAAVGDLTVHRAVEGLCTFHERGSNPRINQIAQDLGYSERHLRNIIKSRIGHSPKLVSKIERFKTTLEKSNHSTDWAHIAYSSGYYDQSHMIAEFQKLIGNSPERLFS